MEISCVSLSVEIGLPLYYCLQRKRIVNTYTCLRAAESCSLTKKIRVDEFFLASNKKKSFRKVSIDYFYFQIFWNTVSV